MGGPARSWSASSPPRGTNSFGNDGIFYGGSGKYGGWNLLWHQIVAAAVVTVFSFGVTLIIAYVVKLVLKMRVTDEEELEGLDIAIHGESAYEFGPVGGGGHVTSTRLLRARRV